MITWVTVWVLTIQYVDGNTSHSLQRTYSTQEQCIKALNRSKERKSVYGTKSCDFQQIPMVTK